MIIISKFVTKNEKKDISKMYQILINFKNLKTPLSFRQNKKSKFKHQLAFIFLQRI